MRLADKVCLITGAGSGIGRASAIMFAGEGATVAIADIDTDGADGTKASIDATGGMSRAYAVDVTDADSVEVMVAAVVADFGRIDVLFNNAGIAGIGLLHETSVEAWDRVFAVNARGVFLVARAVLPQ